MGKLSTITYEQVTAAADTLKTEGAKPTLKAVREQLGNVGSMGTINKFLQRWKAGQVHQVAPALVLPPALQRALLEFMDRELANARAALETDLADQQQAAADLAAENERQADAIDAQTEAAEQLRAEAAALTGRAGQLDADLQDAKGEAARERSAAETARTELAKAQLRLEAMPRLERDLDAVRGAMEAERIGKITAEQTAAVLAAKHEAAERRAAEADARTANADRAMTRLAEKLETMAAALLDASKATQTAQARLEIQTRNADEARASAKKFADEVDALRARLAVPEIEQPEPAAPTVKRKS
jgi:DNA repair exonuclease SbcCD ATPase subunit